MPRKRTNKEEKILTFSFRVRIEGDTEWLSPSDAYTRLGISEGTLRARAVQSDEDRRNTVFSQAYMRIVGLEFDFADPTAEDSDVEVNRAILKAAVLRDKAPKTRYGGSLLSRVQISR